jgi:hypothetical protein
MTDEQVADKIIDLFLNVIDKDSLDTLSKQELKAIDKMLMEAGY